MKNNDDFNEKDTLIEFPARFPIKIIGKNTDEFKKSVAEILKNTLADGALLECRETPSKKDNYIAINALALFNNKQEIDKVYEALSADKNILMAL